MIVNRLSRNNFTHAISSSFHVETVEPYLIFKSSPAIGNADDQPIIFGIWFPADEERKAAFEILSRCVNAQASIDAEKNAVIMKQQQQLEQQPRKRQEQPKRTATLVATQQQLPQQNQPQQQQQAAQQKQQNVQHEQEQKRQGLVKEQSVRREVNIEPSLPKVEQGPPSPPPREHVPTPPAPTSLDQPAVASARVLLTPGMILGESKVPKLGGAPAALDREAFKATLLGLLDDDTFVASFHQKYLSALASR